MSNHGATFASDTPPSSLSLTSPCYRPPLHASHPCSPQGSVSAGLGGSVEERQEGGTGVRLCELLQAGGVSVRPLGKHLAISLPSLPLRLWDNTQPTTHTVQQSRPPVPPPPVETPRPQSSPMWQPPRPHSPTRHWSSWSLDRPDAVVSPYDTPPDRCLPIRSPQPSAYSRQSSPGHYSSQHAPGLAHGEEAELTELDSLYQASLQAGRTVYSPSERLISRVGGPARSKTPSADMERSMYGADCSGTPTYLNKPMGFRDRASGAEPGDSESLRRIGRSLSGTVVNSRHHRLTATRSFELSGGTGSFWLCLTGVKVSSDQSPALFH